MIGKKSIINSVLLFVLILIGFLYVRYVWFSTKNEQSGNALQIAITVEAALSKLDIQQLSAFPSDETTDPYKRIEEKLQFVISANPNAKFAYLYLQRDGKLYFMVDSEPKDSKAKSPPGQEFTEADSIDFLPFKTGKPQITSPVTDRWGTWVSIEVPLKKKDSGIVYAVLGIDYDATSWKKELFFQVWQSSSLAILSLILLIAVYKSREKNKTLKREILERKQAEKKVYENERQLSGLISNLKGLVYRCALDEHYTMEFISDACLRITGYSPYDFINNKNITFNDLILEEYQQPIWEKWQKKMKEKLPFEDEYPIRTASGEIKWVWERGDCIFSENGDLLYLEGYIEDITEKRMHQTELFEAKQKAEESDRLKSAFLANLSHEIRTPMNGILGFAELIKDPEFSLENKNDFYNELETNIKRLLNVINDLVEISKIAAGDQKLNIRKTNINKLLQELHLLYLPVGNKKNLQLNYHCSLTESECDIETDRIMLYQIMDKLLNNAIKFTAKGTVNFGYLVKEAKLEFYVSDSGCGIDEQTKMIIFDRFRQADQSLVRRYEGAGLGLSIAKAHIEMLGGSIGVESEVGKGSTFYFELPLTIN